MATLKTDTNFTMKKCDPTQVGSLPQQEQFIDAGKSSCPDPSTHSHSRRSLYRSTFLQTIRTTLHTWIKRFTKRVFLSVTQLLRLFLGSKWAQMKCFAGHRAFFSTHPCFWKIAKRHFIISWRSVHPYVFQNANESLIAAFAKLVYVSSLGDACLHSAHITHLQ